MPRKKKSQTDELKEALRSTPATPEPKWLSSGSTLINLACSGRPDGCYKTGCYYNYVGASASGKSFLILTAFAEAANDPAFLGYRLIYDNPENSLTMDVGRFFGKKMASRLETVYSPSVEGFYYHLDDCFTGRPFVYVLDSMDSLEPDADRDKFDELKKGFLKKRATGKGPDVSGSYGTAKAKANSNGLRLVMDPLRETGSILIVVSQSRKNVGFGAQFNPDVQSGGLALKFYAQLQLWTSVKELIKRRVRGKDRQVGIKAKVHVKKNRFTGRDRGVTVPIYHSTGVGEVDSLVDFLIEEKYWDYKEKGDVLTASEFDHEGSKEDLIRLVQGEKMEKDLARLVADHWASIEDECRLERKSKYE